MTHKVKWGILGFARIAKLEVIPAIVRSENSELYAVAYGDPQKRAECSEIFNSAKLYERYEELLEDPEVQAVYIPLPNSMHKEWAIKAMQQGKHVLCEKPMALNSDECAEMIQAAEDNHVILMEAFMYRYTDRIQKVSEIVKSGEIGTIKYINSTFRFLLNRPNTIKVSPKLGGGSLYDVGSYPVNFIGMVTGSVPDSCVSQYVIENGVDMIFTAVLKYPNGIIAAINSGFNAFSQMNTEMIGTKGRLEIPDTFSGVEGAITVVTDSGLRKVEISQSDRYRLEIEDFADAVLGQRKPLLSLEETSRNMKVMDMLLASIQYGDETN